MKTQIFRLLCIGIICIIPLISGCEEAGSTNLHGYWKLVETRTQIGTIEAEEGDLTWRFTKTVGNRGTLVVSAVEKSSYISPMTKSGKYVYVILSDDKIKIDDKEYRYVFFDNGNLLIDDKMELDGPGYIFKKK